MGRYKVPSQAASGADSFSDDLVGNQITQGSPLMTGTNFAIEKSIPEKDSKKFITQPFSKFLTWDDIQKESTTDVGESIVTSTTSTDIKFNNDKLNADKSLYGSLKQRLGVSVSNIISKYPAAIMVDGSSPISLNKNTAEYISYDILTNTTEFQIQYSLLYNPFNVIFKSPESNVIPETGNNIRNFYSSYTKYIIDLSGSTYNIVDYIETNNTNKITIRVDGNCFLGYSSYTENYLIRPNNGIVENFYDELDDIERSLLNRDTNPIFNAGFNIPRDTHGGYTTETITEYVNWPLSRDGWNIQIIGLDYNFYINKLSNLGEEIDGYKSNLIIRFLTSPQLYEFDTEEKKIESIFQIYGQSFDKVKKFIDNIAYMRNVSYDSINNVPDVLLKNLSETLGLSTISLFDEKSLEDSLYTRHDIGYGGVSNGTNLIEAEYEFYRRLLVNLAWLYKSKGTRTAIEFFLKFIGAPEPMIRLDEYVYKVDGPLPSTNVESDIQDVILGYKTFNVVSYNTGTTQYELLQITGSTSLTRSEYPVDESTGLPKAIEYTDGSMFFQKGAGWYRKTLDHRSPDILDEVNSDLSSRVKVIKTMSKPFTYGEDYFNVYRNLPGLGYGYNLTSEIDNEKTEVVEDEYTSKLTLNRKNINVFLSSDRAIDYDIYNKSRNLSLDFGAVTTSITSGITFAEFIETIFSSVIKNSHIIRYKPFYVDLLTVYNEYESSQSFTPYTYISVNDFINRLSPYWVNIIEQFIPATTLWTGGNVIENGLFNRSKLKYRQPCVPLTFTEEAFPDFETVINEDIESIIGGGSYDGNDNALENFRGLQIFSGVTFNLMLEINGNVYTGATFNIQPFSGFSPSSDCTILTATTDSIPLICGYSGNTFTSSDITELTEIREAWKEALNQLINEINLIYSGESYFKISVEYFQDVDRTQPAPRDVIEYVRLTIVFNEYYGCTGNETFDYYFEPSYNLGNEGCDLQISVEAVGGQVFDDISSCQLNTDLKFTASNVVGDESGGWPIYIRTGCTEDINSDPIQQSSGCVYVIPSIREIDKFGMLFTDAANCEQKIKVDGLQPVIINNLGTSGYTAVARTEYRPTYNFGIRKGSTVYVLNHPVLTPPSGYTEMEEWITSGRLVEIPVENLLTGYTILSLELKSYSEMSTSQFNYVSISGYSFAFDYVFKKLTARDCLSTTKTSIINGEYEVLPTSKVLVYTNVDIDLQSVPYRFEWKYPQDIFVKDGTSNGDYLIDYRGFGIEVSGVTLDYCTYDKTFYQLNFENSTDETNNIVINGLSGTSYNKIIVSIKQEGIDPLTFNLHQLFIGLGYDESSSINATRTVDPGWGVCTDGLPIPTTTPSISPSITRTPTPSKTIMVSPSPSPSVTVTPSMSITPTVTPSISVSPSVTPSISVSPSITPSISVSPSITPSISVSPSVTPSISVSPSVTPTIPETPSVTPSISVSPSVTPSVSISPSITPTMSETPSITPSMTTTTTPTPSISVSSSYIASSYINFTSLDGNVGEVGFSGSTLTGRTFNVTLHYIITASVDNNWSNGMDPVQAYTYFYLSTDSGSTYNEINYVYAEVPGNGPPEESDESTIDTTYTLTNITEEELRGIRVYGQYDYSYTTNTQYGSIEVRISEITTNIGYTNILCNNIYSMAGNNPAELSCGTEVTPTPSTSTGWVPTPSITPTITATPSITPTPTRTQTATPTPSPLAYSYLYYVQSWSCSLESCGDLITYENIRTQVPLVVGKWYTLAEDGLVYYIESTTIVSGAPRDLIGGPYETCSDACSSPLVTPTQQAPSPSRTRTVTPSVTPTRTITPSISVTPSPTPETIHVYITNELDSSTSIDGCTIDDQDLKYGTFPIYPGNTGDGFSPVGTGVYTIVLQISGARINTNYVTLSDSNSVEHCITVYPMNTQVVFTNCAVNTTSSINIYLHSNAQCPTATPSVTRSISVSRTPSRTQPSSTPTPSVTPTIMGSPTPTPSPSVARYLTLDNYYIGFDEYGSPCGTGQIEITSNYSSWTATLVGDVAPYLNINGGGWGNEYIGSGNETITISARTGEYNIGYIIFSAVGLSPNVSCVASTGDSCL